MADLVDCALCIAAAKWQVTHFRNVFADFVAKHGYLGFAVQALADVLRKPVQRRGTLDVQVSVQDTFRSICKHRSKLACGLKFFGFVFHVLPFQVCLQKVSTRQHPATETQAALFPLHILRKNRRRNPAKAFL